MYFGNNTLLLEECKWKTDSICIDRKRSMDRTGVMIISEPIQERELEMPKYCHVRYTCTCQRLKYNLVALSEFPVQ